MAVVETERRGQVLIVRMNRPERLNALNGELRNALADTWTEFRESGELEVAIFTGTGRAFCAGEDMKESLADGAPGGRRPEREDPFMSGALEKPVIAAVNGYAIGGGHVLHVICDLTIAADTARFGQVGPRVGSVDPGYGTAYLARAVGEKKAREIWYLCRQYTAQQALEMGLVNAVVPADQLIETAKAWAREMLAFSPTALKIAKASFNADSDSIKGIGAMGMAALALYYGTEEAMEGRNAFMERRPPDFGKYRR
jgi:2-ketocyclohexanecarboxyl-CoA hydrolase